MNILVFSPVALSPVLRSAGANRPAGGGWVEAMITAMCGLDKSLRFVVVCRGNPGYDVVEGPVRCLTADDKCFAKTAKRIVSEFKPDVIHVNGTEFVYGAFPAETYGGVPVVVSMQGVISGYYPHYAGALTRRELAGTGLTLRNMLKGDSIFGEQEIWRRFRAKTEARTIGQHKYFVGRTEWDEAWVRYYNPSAGYFHVDETLRDPFYNIERNPAGIAKHTIFCGGAAGYPLKGAHWLIRAVASLRTEYPDIKLKIAAARDRIGPDRNLKARLKDSSYAIYLRRLISKLAAEDCVIGLPSLSAEEVAAELKGAELFVLPSLCENSPNSLGEAMLAGTPAIATFAGGTPSILRDGVEGKLVPSADPAALAGAIRHWFEHPEEAERCAAKAKETAIARHDKAKNAKALLNVFKEVVANAT